MLPGVLKLSIDESLIFGNLAAIAARLGAELEKTSATHDVVLVMSGVKRVDTIAMDVLSDINKKLASRNIRLHLAEVKGPMQDRLVQSPLWTALSGNVHYQSAAASCVLSSDARRRLSSC